MDLFALTGILCKGHNGEPAVKSGDTTKGTLFATASLAVYNFYKKESEYFPLTAYGKMAEVLLRANPGDQISVSGRHEWYRYEFSGRTFRGIKFVCNSIDLARGGNSVASHNPPPGAPDKGYEGPEPDYGRDDEPPF